MGKLTNHQYSTADKLLPPPSLACCVIEQGRAHMQVGACSMHAIGNHTVNRIYTQQANILVHAASQFVWVAW